MDTEVLQRSQVHKKGCGLNRGQAEVAMPLAQQNFSKELPSLHQSTVGGEVRFSGIGLFTGERTEIKICPAPADTGIVFIRTDLPGAPVIPARLSFVQEALRCTRIGAKGAYVLMVEHLLSALFGCGVHNAFIEVKGSEIPSGDGSALPFVEALESVSIRSLSQPLSPLKVEQPLFWSDGTISLVALPSSSFSVSYTLHYPQSKRLGSQYVAYTHSKESYKAELAPCRTFSLYEEIMPFIEKGWIKGGSLDNALVIRGDEVLNPEGARFFDEPARHKVLDLLGDLALLGRPLSAHILAICSGHASHHAFANVLSNHFKMSEVHGG